MASDVELSDFLRSVEKRAYKRSLYHVRDEDGALDIVQDSMIKLAEHYGDRPAAELPLLFQRILSTTTLDWFRRQKTRTALFSTLSDLEKNSDPENDGGSNLLELLAAGPDGQGGVESAEDSARRTQVLQAIEDALSYLPVRQREAFLLRYWEEMDVAETATVMGCSEGSVKTHCSRAVRALAQVLHEKGIKP